MEKLLLIDGNSIMNRAFYGVPELTNVNGLHTNAVYGFLNILYKFLDEEHPDYLAIAFDLHAPTFRHKMYEGYKGTRKGMPDELREQVPYLKSLIKSLNISILELEGYEADDLLGTMAKRAQNKGIATSLISGDRDLLQIADENIKIRIPKTVRGVTTVEDYYPKDVVEKYHVTPKEFIELKALMGDSSDNIPGVPKVGAKTAEELIVTYHSLDGIYENIENITKNAIKNSLAENKDLAYLCLKLATIEINSPIDVDFENLKTNLTYTKEGLDIVRELNLRTYIKKFEDNLSDNVVNESLDLSFDTVDGFDSFDRFSNALNASKEASAIFSDLGTAFLFDEKFTFVPKMFDLKNVIKAFLEKEDHVLITEKASDIYDLLDKEYLYKISHDITDKVFSVDIAGYLVNPLNKEYNLSSLCSNYLTVSVDDNPKDEDGVIKKCHYLNKLYIHLKEELNSSEQYELFKNIEMPLSLVLYEMEKTGIYIDTDELSSYAKELEEKISVIEKSIFEEAGEEFNINSPKQLGVILFEKMQMPYSKKTKTGYSTSAEVLDKLSLEYPFVKKILEYRMYSKLLSTYAIGLKECVKSDLRIHSKFLQTVTATGRLSSVEPNLQNIPVRSEEGKILRKAFKAKEGCIFADADYSQIELRILAHLSDDETLINAFNSGQDIHSVTASNVFKVPIEEVTSSQRRSAKVINFGIIYGMSSFSLGQDLEISKKEAEKYIADYFDKYPKIKGYLDSCVKEASEKGYSLTALGRRRPIPELKASNFMQREFGKRVAMNAPIQGTAADIMKIAMINVRDALIKNNLKSTILVQVHDELLLEIPKEEKDAATKILKEEMENAYKMSVSLSSELNVGDNWYEAK